MKFYRVVQYAYKRKTICTIKQQRQFILHNGINIYRGYSWMYYCDSRSKCYNMSMIEDIEVKSNASELLNSASKNVKMYD